MNEQPSIHDKIIFMILFSIISVGMYVPYWIYKKREFFNSLNSDKKITNTNIIILFTIFAIHTVTYILTLFINPITNRDLYINISSIESLSFLLSIIFLLVVCFKMSKIINNHFNVRNSVMGILFFTIFYFQYKINILTNSGNNNTNSNDDQFQEQQNY